MKGWMGYTNCEEAGDENIALSVVVGGGSGQRPSPARAQLFIALASPSVCTSK